MSENGNIIALLIAKRALEVIMVCVLFWEEKIIGMIPLKRSSSQNANVNIPAAARAHNPLNIPIEYCMPPERIDSTTQPSEITNPSLRL